MGCAAPKPKVHEPPLAPPPVVEKKTPVERPKPVVKTPEPEVIEKPVEKILEPEPPVQAVVESPRHPRYFSDTAAPIPC